MSFFRSIAFAGIASLALAPLRGADTPKPPAKPRVVDTVGRITLVDEQPAQVAALLSKITGRMLLRTGDLPPSKINFQSGRELTRAEAEMALESLLALNGVAVFPEGESFLKVVPAYKGKEPSGEAPQLYLESVANLPPSDRFVARLFTFRNVSYSTVDAAMQLVVNKARGANAVPMPGANAVLVTDSLSNMQRIEAIVGTIDSATKVIFVPLKHTRAGDVVKQLKALQAAGLKLAFAGEVGFEASEVSNQIMAVTSAANEARIREMIAGIDTEVPPVTHSELILLRHADAADMVQLVQNLSSGTSGTIGQNSPASASRSSSLTGAGSRTERGGSSANNSRRSSGDGRTLTSINHNVDSSKQAASAVDDASFSPYFTVVADARSNSIVAYGTDRDMKQVKDLVSKVDVQLPQVRIEVVIVEVTLQDNQASGLDSLGLGFYTGTQGVVNGRKNGDVNFNAAQPNLPGSNAPPFALRGSLKDFSLETIFNKARNDSKVKLLSSPTIVTAHNAPAELKVTTQQPIITGTTNVPNNGTLATNSQVDYKDIGLQLDITPRIGANGVVEMNVEQQIGSIIGNVTIDGNSQPIISNRSANSYITAKNDETVVLAGLQSVTETKTKGKLFLLGYIPWLGDWLFSPETSQTAKTELIIFLKPHVLSDSDIVPAKDTPGIRDGALTKEIVDYRLKEGVFAEAREQTTIFERDDAKEKERKALKDAEKAEAEKQKNAPGANR